MKKFLNTMEYFAGTCSFSKVMRLHGHTTFTVDNDPRFDCDMTIDILKMRGVKSAKHDIIWASPPCQGFSVAVIGRNWNHDGTPKTDSARLAMKLAKKTLSIIEALKPHYYFIENPRGMLRKMKWMDAFLKRTGGKLVTVAYCQYGDDRQKPTDIWTNAHFWKPRPLCKPGSSCHVAAPRGSKTGTQGLKNAMERGRIPEALFEEILSQYENSRRV